MFCLESSQTILFLTFLISRTALLTGLSKVHAISKRGGSTEVKKVVKWYNWYFSYQWLSS